MVGSGQLFLQCAGTVHPGRIAGRGKRCLCGGEASGDNAGRNKLPEDNLQGEAEREVAAQNREDDHLRGPEKESAGYEEFKKTASYDRCRRKGAEMGCKDGRFLLCPEVVLSVVVRPVLEHNQEILQKSACRLKEK